LRLRLRYFNTSKQRNFPKNSETQHSPTSRSQHHLGHGSRVHLLPLPKGVGGAAPAGRHIRSLSFNRL